MSVSPWRRVHVRTDAVRQRGEAVHVDPIKPTLRAPGIKRLKLKCDKLRSTFAFKFNLRRYTKAAAQVAHEGGGGGANRQGLTLVHIRAQLEQLQDTFMS